MSKFARRKPSGRARARVIASARSKLGVAELQRHFKTPLEACHSDESVKPFHFGIVSEQTLRYRIELSHRCSAQSQQVVCLSSDQQALLYSRLFNDTLMQWGCAGRVSIAHLNFDGNG